MFRLYRVEKNGYILRADNGYKVTGTRPEIIKAMLLMGVDTGEIFEGIRALELGDDVADYGINLMFIFSKKLAA